MGILFALGALVSWGVGDFLIQRSARKFGDGIALFFITFMGMVVLLPFVWHDIPFLFSSYRSVIILWSASLVLLGAALLDFEALRIGKISVIEPIYAFEVVVTASLGTLLLKEHLSTLQVCFIATLIAGITLVGIKKFRLLKSFRLERGVLLAVGATIMMGAVNFLFGAGARESGPIIINWFTSTFITVFIGVYITINGEWHHLYRQWSLNRPLVVAVGFIDNLAWVFFAYSTLAIPIAIATSISEAYVALAAILGFWLNRERLSNHQLIGLVLTVSSTIALAITLK